VQSTTPNLKDTKSKEEITAKLVSEVYLTRLLATKGGMQSFVDDFFESVFSTAHGSSVLPFAVKYLFDFLDDQASLHGITDPDVVHTWKSNSLPLRFWVNIIKNPDFVFDIHKSNIVDASLSVIAATFMDACSQSRLDLNKESPSGKLLFYKEVHKYRKWVESYYGQIRQMPRISEQELSEILGQESKKSAGVFNRTVALSKLYGEYVKRYRPQMESVLNDVYQDQASASVNKHLNYRLQQTCYLMDAIDV
jgi:plexin A